MRHIVLVGGGHSHVQVLKSFAEEPAPKSRLTVVVDTPIAVYSGMVPGFVAGQYRTQELEIDVRPLAHRAHAEIVVAAATAVDVTKQQIVTESGPPVPYDLASFDIGSTVAGLDLPGIREHALPTRPIARFVRRIDEVVQRARAHDGATPFKVVVVGGGAGGVEVAFTMEHRLKQDTTGPIEVMLIENGPRILSSYSDAVVSRVHRRAAVRGIEIRCDQKVLGASVEHVEVSDGEGIPFDVLLWVTGAVSHPVFRESGVPTDDRGFVRTRSTLQFEKDDNLFATGDCGTLIDYPRTPKAGVYAVRQGPVITNNIRAWLAGHPLHSYTPQSDFLALLNLGDGTAIGAKWGRSIEGRWVMRLKDWIDRRFMRRFQLTDAERSTGSPNV